MFGKILSAFSGSSTPKELSGGFVSAPLKPQQNEDGSYEVPLDCIVGVHEFQDGRNVFLEIANRVDPSKVINVIQFNRAPEVLLNDGSKSGIHSAIPSTVSNNMGEEVRDLLEHIKSYRQKNSDEGLATRGEVFKVSASELNMQTGTPISLIFDRKPTIITKNEFMAMQSIQPIKTIYNSTYNSTAGKHVSPDCRQ